MEYVHGGDIYTYENVTDYSVNLNPFWTTRGSSSGNGRKFTTYRCVSG